MFLKDLFEPVAQLFRFAALAFNHKDFMANGAFARSRQADLESGYQFRFLKHAPCCHNFAQRILSPKVPIAFGVGARALLVGPGPVVRAPSTRARGSRLHHARSNETFPCPSVTS